MKFFVDAANPSEIKKAYEMGVIDAVTTNPTLSSKEKRDFESLNSRDLQDYQRAADQP